MSDWIDAEGYRANVGIVLMRDTGEVFLGQRTGARGWQFPQGGIRQGEPIEQALFRELREEIGLERQHVQVAGSTADWIRYKLPKRYVRRGRGPLCIGQKQRWYLLTLAVPEVSIEFSFTHTNEPEFDGWRWPACCCRRCSAIHSPTPTCSASPGARPSARSPRC